MRVITSAACKWLGAGVAGMMLAGAVQADHHGMKADIVDTAVAAGQFETLVAAVKAADLVDTLKGEGPFTVFAPTDEAFAALPAGTLDELLMPENRDRLQAILTYHVVPGKVMAEQAMGLSSATTVQGQDLTLTTENGSVRIDDATVIQADVVASNGVIHVIDGVLMPE
ncbi:fasciclin domain-containing protein [Billgrantia azerbaijanica]|nr:fasciclin domain-containing protein [Halomonas azerbaijanica]